MGFDYNIDDHYPLYVDILYPAMIVHCVCARARITNTWTTYRDICIYIDRYIHIHKYSDFLVVMISVGLALASSPQLYMLYWRPEPYAYSE